MPINQTAEKLLTDIANYTDLTKIPWLIKSGNTSTTSEDLRDKFYKLLPLNTTYERDTLTYNFNRYPGFTSINFSTDTLNLSTVLEDSNTQQFPAIMFQLENFGSTKVANGLVLVPREYFWPNVSTTSITSIPQLITFTYRDPTLSYTNPNSIKRVRLQHDRIFSYGYAHLEVQIGTEIEIQNFYRFHVIDMGNTLNSTISPSGETIFFPRNNKQFEAGLDYYFNNLTDILEARQKMPFTYVDNSIIGKINLDSTIKEKIGKWKTNLITDMSYSFSPFTSNSLVPLNSRANRITFNEDISEWNTEAVINMNSMFRGDVSFNQIIEYDPAVPSLQKNWKYDYRNIVTYEPSSTTSGSTTYQWNTYSTNTVVERARINLYGNVLSGFSSDLTSLTIGTTVYLSKIILTFALSIVSAPSFNSWERQAKISLIDGSTVLNSWTIRKGPLVILDTTISVTLTAVTDLHIIIEIPTGGIQGDGPYGLTFWNYTSGSTTHPIYSHALEFYTEDTIIPWDVSGVKYFESMFEDAISFNQDLNKWYLKDAVSLKNMFKGALAFDNSGNPIKWNANYLGTSVLTDVSNVESMFENATSFNSYIENWKTSKCVNFKNMFKNATSFNNGGNPFDLSLSLASNLESMFEGALIFNQNVNNMGKNRLSTAPSMNLKNMFKGAISFNNGNQAFTAPPSFAGSSKNSLESMFEDATSFNQDITLFRSSIQNCTSFKNMFKGSSAFDNSGSAINWNLPLNSSNTMEGMFQDAVAFNQDISSFDVRNVTDMSGMFKNAVSFNQDITSWDVGNVASMNSMFQGTPFNQDISGWNVSNVSNMQSMFQGTPFNQDISGWIVNSVTDFRKMFKNAINFDQNIRGWDVSSTALTNEMFFNTSLLLDASYRFIPNGWLGYKGSKPAIFNNGSPTNIIFFSTTPAIIPFFPQTNNDFRDGLKYYFDPSYTVPLPDPSSTFATSSNVGKHSLSSTKNAIELWITENITDMSGAFENRVSFNQDLSGWHMEQVEKMGNMFKGASSYNNGESTNTGSRPLNWAIRNLYDLSSSSSQALAGLFEGATSFNQQLGCANWDVSNCINFSYMFSGCNKITDTALTGINIWNTHNVENMRNMFTNCNDPSFVTPGIQNWNTNNIISNDGLTEIFKGATNFNEDISTKNAINYIAWNTIHVRNFQDTFKNASSFNNGDISGASTKPLNWHIYGSLESMFEGASSFNQNLDVQTVEIGVTNDALIDNFINIYAVTSYTYVPSSYPSSSLDKDLELGFTLQASNFLTRVALSFHPDFKGETSTLDIFTKKSGTSTWVLVSYLTGLSFEKDTIVEIVLPKPSSLPPYFAPGQPFDIRIRITNPSGWVEQAGDYSYRIDTLKTFTNYIPWNVSNTQNFSSMFKNASSFNRPLNNWNTQNARYMSHMFDGASSFNQNITQWDISGVLDIKYMFKNATDYNNGSLPLEWITTSLSGDAIKGLFCGASSFNQNLNENTMMPFGYKRWDLSAVTIFSEVFKDASSFNNGQNYFISRNKFNWNTENAIEMSNMFENAVLFNNDIDHWFSEGKLLDMSNAQVGGGTNGLREMLKGAEEFVSFARKWKIPGGSGVIDITDIFEGATDMSSVFYLRRSDTGYDSTPSYSFFNYDASSTPIKFDISYTDGETNGNVACNIVPASFDISGLSNALRPPYNLPFTLAPTYAFDYDASTLSTVGDGELLDVIIENALLNPNVYDVMFSPTRDNEDILIKTNLQFVSFGELLFSIPVEINVKYGTLPVPIDPIGPIPTVPSDPGRSHHGSGRYPIPQKPHRRYACSNFRRSGCAAYLPNHDKNGNFFNGNTNQPNFMQVEAYKYSNVVNYAARRYAGKNIILHYDLNVFGRYEGAPGGSGEPLKNKY